MDEEEKRIAEIYRKSHEYGEAYEYGRRTALAARDAEVAELDAELASERALVNRHLARCQVCHDANVALLEHVRVEGRLGEYLNTMVADLGLMDRGEYLRDLFGRYEDEAEALYDHNVTLTKDRA